MMLMNVFKFQLAHSQLVIDTLIPVAFVLSCYASLTSHPSDNKLKYSDGLIIIIIVNRDLHVK